VALVQMMEERAEARDDLLAGRSVFLAHELRIGTSPGAYDLFKSGTITSPGVLVPALPQTGTLYARALSKVNTIWMFTDIPCAADIVIETVGL